MASGAVAQEALAGDTADGRKNRGRYPPKSTLEVAVQRRPDRMNVQVECWCGDEMDVHGDPIEAEADLRTECPNCGRRYVLTLTRYRDATDD